MTLDSRTLAVGDKLHRPSKPHMRYQVFAVDDTHVEVGDQMVYGATYTHAEFREHMADAIKVSDHPPVHLTVAQAADMLGIKPSTFRAYVSRGEVPPADSMLDGRTPLWDVAVIHEIKTEGRRGKPASRASVGPVPLS